MAPFEITPLTKTIPSYLTDSQQAVILSHECEGINNENSIFAAPVFWSMQEREEYRSPFTARIYRTILPWNGEGDAFETLSQRTNKTIERIELGDI